MLLRQGHPWATVIHKFLYSPAYFFLIGFLTVLSNTCNAELFVYTCFIIIGIYICFMARDLLPLTPMIVCGYITPSVGNNPGVNDSSIFSFHGGGLYIILLVVLFLISLIYRLATDPDFGGKKFFARKRTLLPGILALGFAYLLSGFGSGQWDKIGWQNLLFATLQFLSIGLIYFILSGGICWEQAPEKYLAWAGVCVGYVLLAELLFIFWDSNIIFEGRILRDKIYTGWGHYNNIGALLAMMIPFPFFLTGKSRYPSLFYFTALLFFAGLLLTCSRGSILFGIIIYLISYIFSLFSSGQARRSFGIHIFTVLLAGVLIFYYSEELRWLFFSIVNAGFASKEREEIYSQGIAQFLKFPIFGGSFFPVNNALFSWSTSESFVSFFPPRWHNTLIQILASCGTVGIVAYLFHRVQTILLFIRDFSREKMFVAFSILALLLTSMLDCHLFNIGPAMFYSVALTFVEHGMCAKKKTL